MGLPKQFLNKRPKKTKAYFDEISEGITFSNPKKRFFITMFLLMMDILSCQLINRFEGMKSVMTSYQVLELSFLSNASHLDLDVEARKFSNKLPKFIFISLLIQIEKKAKLALCNSKTM